MNVEALITSVIDGVNPRLLVLKLLEDGVLEAWKKKEPLAPSTQHYEKEAKARQMAWKKKAAQGTTKIGGNPKR